jgi:hypothetical protein
VPAPPTPPPGAPPLAYLSQVQQLNRLYTARMASANAATDHWAHDARAAAVRERNAQAAEFERVRALYRAWEDRRARLAEARRTIAPSVPQRLQRLALQRSTAQVMAAEAETRARELATELAEVREAMGGTVREMRRQQSQQGQQS